MDGAGSAEVTHGVLQAGARYGKTRSTADPANEPGHVDGSCLNCDRPVSATFARVFGDNADRVYGCFECMTISAIKQGAAPAPDAKTGSR